MTVDAAVKKGVAEGKNIYAISRSGRVAGMPSQSALHSWIASGRMATKRADLPKAAKCRKRARKKCECKGSSNAGKEGRRRLDYIAMRRASPELRYAIGAGAFARVPPFILMDNGPCFSGFGAIEFSAETGEKRTAACFCDPYVSNQKAGAENMDGQLRRHFPKEGDVDEYADEYVAQSFGNINSAPLKSLGGEIARAIEEFVKGRAKPRLGNGLHPRKRTSAPFFGARGNGAESASSRG